MKLLTLNIWGGHVRTPLLEFIEAHRDIDIFCLQEVYHQAEEKISDDDKQVSLNIFSDLHTLLPGHSAFFSPAVREAYGIGMFVKKTIDILDTGTVTIYDNPHYCGLGPTHSRHLQWLKCAINGKLHTFLNVHGLWNGKGKIDSPDRIAQSRAIKNFMDSVAHPKILCGDFNLRPDTESIKILENGMDNLIRRYAIRSTRTRFYPKEEKFADYVFTSPDITIQKFEALRHEVSDHSPLLLEFSTRA